MAYITSEPGGTEFRIENIQALDRLKARFARLQNPDLEDLMFAWTIIIEKDNQAGILAGLDKHGSYMLAVTYRPEKPGGKKLTRDQKLGQKGNRRGQFGGFGPMASGLHNNLTAAEYRQLGGPPLAPRGRYSRVITNLQTDWARGTSGAGLVYGQARWKAYGYWREVVSTKGDDFLKYHFHGIGRMPVRDLTGLRPDGMEKARRAAVNKMYDLVRSGGV